MENIELTEVQEVQDQVDEQIEPHLVGIENELLEFIVATRNYFFISNRLNAIHELGFTASKDITDSIEWFYNFVLKTIFRDGGRTYTPEEVHAISDEISELFDGTYENNEEFDNEVIKFYKKWK